MLGDIWWLVPGQALSQAHCIGSFAYNAACEPSREIEHGQQVIPGRTKA